MKGVTRTAFVAITLLVVLVVSAAAGVASEMPVADPSEALAPDSPSSLLFSYQGQLTDAAGNAISNPAMPITFRLFTVSSGGTACWTENHTGANSVAVEKGLFHVLLGQISAINVDACLAGDAYLELVVNGETLSPRELLTSVAYAVQAQDVTGVITGQYGGGITNGCGTLSERYYVGSLRHSDASVYEKLFVTVWGGGYLNTSLGKDFYSISSREGLKVTRTRLFGATESYALKVYDNGSSYDIVIEVLPPCPNLLIRSQKMADPHAIQEQRVVPGYDPAGKTDITPTIQNQIITDQNGNVGIGTLAPKTALHIPARGLELGTSTTATENFHLAVENTVGPLALRLFNGDYGSGTHLLTVTPGGNVGIGTANPQKALHIAEGKSARLELGVDQKLSLGGVGSLEIDAPSVVGGRLVVTNDGKVGIGVPAPSEALDIAGNVQARGAIKIGDQGTIAATVDRTGSGPHMVFNTDDAFTFQTDQGGWLRISSNPYGVNFEGVSWFYLNNSVVPTTDAQYDLGGVGRRWRTAYLGSASCGAITEANLQTAEEKSAGRIDRFEEGDVLCWGIDQLELCAMANDRLVQAVADKSGNPIVLGAEKVKVVGPVQRGDILVASAVPGYAMVNNEPRSGSVIAQALENFDGERGVIKAMIRKF